MRVIIAFLMSLMVSFAACPAQKAMGTLELKNGEKHVGVVVEIPAGTEEEVKIKADGKKIKIKSEDVARLILWHEKNPDNKYLMVYSDRREIDYEKGIDRIEKYKKWFVLKNPGENVSVWVYACMIDVGKNGISLAPCDTKYGYNTFYNFWKNGDETPVFMKFHRKTEETEAWCARFFSDDKALSEKILNREYRAGSYKESRRFGTMLCAILIEKIAEDYSPVR